MEQKIRAATETKTTCTEADQHPRRTCRACQIESHESSDSVRSCEQQHRIGGCTLGVLRHWQLDVFYAEEMHLFFARLARGVKIIIDWDDTEYKTRSGVWAVVHVLMILAARGKGSARAAAHHHHKIK